MTCLLPAQVHSHSTARDFEPRFAETMLIVCGFASTVSVTIFRGEVENRTRWLDLLRLARDSHAGTVAQTSIMPTPLRILIVEDVLDTAASMSMLLRLQGHDVVCAADGLAGLELAAKHSPDVVLLDLGLPKLDGYAVASRLRQAPGKCPLLIAITGYAHPEARARSLASGIALHLVKPIDPDELLRFLNHYGGVM
ncbi:hypothetical protein AYO40_04730 [Planctomycetaceae bacterium SCGC AG-212-D15]|nr:hypothetical protein AYO40_04730 [Planctomycetaceae bacterium SCGC AG-212-D15]